MSVQSCGKAVPKAQKVYFSISQYYVCEYSSQRPGKVITADYTDGFIRFLVSFCPNKIPDLPNEKAFPYGMCPINIQKMADIKQVMKYSDHDHHDFWTSILAWENNQQRGPRRVKYWAKNESGGLKCKLKIYFSNFDKII
jgi:hypothetical protein